MGPCATNFNESFIKIKRFSFKKMRWKCCLENGDNVLKKQISYKPRLKVIVGHNMLVCVTHDQIEILRRILRGDHINKKSTWITLVRGKFLRSLEVHISLMTTSRLLESFWMLVFWSTKTYSKAPVVKEAKKILYHTNSWSSLSLLMAQPQDVSLGSTGTVRTKSALYVSNSKWPLANITEILYAYFDILHIFRQMA